jgi:hypothetical protein
VFSVKKIVEALLAVVKYRRISEKKRGGLLCFEMMNGTWRSTGVQRNPSTTGTLRGNLWKPINTGADIGSVAYIAVFAYPDSTLQFGKNPAPAE